MGMLHGKADGQVALAGQKVLAKKRATVSHSVYLSRNMDDDNYYEASIIKFPNKKTMGGQTA
jgi:hypothetical protein